MSNFKIREKLLGSLEDNEEEKALKQEYLIEHVINQNYDRTEFADYMISMKEDGMNIDNWSLIELMDIVKDFK